MNSPLVLNAAEHLAGDLIAKQPEARARASELFMRTLGRPITEPEVAEILGTSEKLGEQLRAEGVSDAERERAVWTSLCQTMLMSNEFLYVK
jgi:hypothetical protein